MEKTLEKPTRKAAQPISQTKSAQPLTPFEAMDRLFESYFPGGWLRPFHAEWPSWSHGVEPFEGKTPKVDVIDRDQEIFIKAELPGVDKKDIDVSVTHNTVTIKGHTRHEEKQEKGDYYRCEISRGAYSRTVMLPAEVADDKARAKFKDGVLELTLPKLSKLSRRSIKVD